VTSYSLGPDGKPVGFRIIGVNDTVTMNVRALEMAGSKERLEGEIAKFLIARKTPKDLEQRNPLSFAIEIERFCRYCVQHNEFPPKRKKWPSWPKIR
jgi:hypothetical protein